METVLFNTRVIDTSPTPKRFNSSPSRERADIRATREQVNPGQRRWTISSGFDEQNVLKTHWLALRAGKPAVSTLVQATRWSTTHYSAALILVCLSLVGCNATKETPADSTEAVAKETDPRALMEAAIQAGDWQLADRHANAALIAQPDDPDLLTQVAKVNALCGRKRDAANLLVEAAKSAEFQPASRVDFAVRALVEVGEIYSAIELLELALAGHPENTQQRRMLVGFLAEVQRNERLGPHLKKLIQDRAFDLQLLLAMTDTASRRMSEKTAGRLMERHPADHRVRLVDAFLSLYRHDAAAACQVLEDILKHHPDFGPAHAMYGHALVLDGRWDDLPQWLATAPPSSSDHADYWLALGDAAMENGRPAEATRAFWEATRRDANRVYAWDRLRLAIHRLRASDGQFRGAVGDDQLSIVADQANALLAFGERFNDFAGSGQVSQAAAEKVARALLALGRVWEAEAWSAVATTLTQDRSDQLDVLRKEILRRLKTNPEWVATNTPAQDLDFGFLPEPKLSSDSSVAKRTAVIPSITTHDHLILDEQAVQWGLVGVGEGNNPTDARLAALIRSTGVGGGAIDYDLDGFPDLLMMNAGGTMLKDDSAPNELMRNLGQTFTDVSGFAGVMDRGFGQGVAVGDFNEDGFADLFFANLGTNHLLRNNGDGTFTDCTDLLNDNHPAAWSTSAAFVDLNADSISDLVVSNYCKTVENLGEACPNEEGKLGPCHPLTFPAEFDQFFAATGDGQFGDVTAKWVSDPSRGRGLGIVAGLLDGQQLGTFIANDMTQNFLYSRQPGETMELVDGAAARGVAVDGTTRSQASMGIACSDFDLDGDLDFYVTGFAREYNVLYEQISPGMWTDSTAKLGLVEPTLSMVGFGAQAIDMDNDGIDEIIVTNGHIGDFNKPDVPPYELPLQLFRRQQNGRFAPVDDDSWGEYFRVGHVGRAVWTTDVNRDGRNDIMISHVDEQVRLLINETKDSHDRIAFKLVATDCSRDAVGAMIRFKCNGQSRTLWVLSGDGYFCSNEKTLIAGLGETDVVTDVTVTWQDGSVDQLGTLAANQSYLIAQGSGEAFSLFDYGAP